jgi:hypothetical protein
MGTEEIQAFVVWLMMYAVKFGDKMPTAESQSLAADAEENYEFRLPLTTCKHAAPPTHPHELVLTVALRYPTHRRPGPHVLPS